MKPERKECSKGGDRKYLGLMHPIKFCKAYNRRRMTCTAADNSCTKQIKQEKSNV